MPSSHIHLKLQYALIFVAFPAFLWLAKPRGWIYSVLWLMSAWTVAVMRRKFNYSFTTDWNAPAVTLPVVRAIALRFLPWAAALLIFTWFYLPQAQFFSLPLERPLTWVMVMIWYPVLSVIPQELIFRSFFFRQYECWFARPQVGLFLNAFAFGWLHIFLQQWVPVVFCFIGSYLFADTYRKTKSLAAVCFEHALYGCFVFTIGLGYYFYHGNIAR
jgi:hypothetical protein